MNPPKSIFQHAVLSAEFFEYYWSLLRCLERRLCVVERSHTLRGAAQSHGASLLFYICNTVHAVSVFRIDLTCLYLSYLAKITMPVSSIRWLSVQDGWQASARCCRRVRSDRI
jgi:hypothetical protein